MSRPKQSQVLEITPSHELRFKGPYNDVVTSTLKLFNPSDKRVCFKVKTTAPRRYCVRPNSGLIDGKSAVHVSVMLQPVDGDATDKGKHKFMVQSMFAPDIVEDMDKLWSDASPSELMDSKLRCVFEDPPTTPEKAAQNAHEAAALDVDKEPDNPKTELRLLMEECKRLQAESYKNKTLYDEVKSQARGPKNGFDDVMCLVKSHILIVMIFASFFFGFGVLLGVAI